VRKGRKEGRTDGRITRTERKEGRKDGYEERKEGRKDASKISFPRKSCLLLYAYTYNKVEGCDEKNKDVNVEKGPG
jgi:hypothetical protein